MLLHELAHLKRRDPMALWAAQLMQAMHWFNPLAWMTLRRLRADQERACDDVVLNQGVLPSDYAQHLLELSRQTRLAPGLGLCALAMARLAPVENRVNAILDPRLKRDGSSWRWSIALLSLGLLIALPVAMLHANDEAPLRGRILDRNGVVLAETTKEHIRHYPLKALASHVLGYTRTADQNHPLQFGGYGIEKQSDALLSEGKDVTLTLDARMQQITHHALVKGKVIRGAAIVMDPRNGDVLAMDSVPNFDPNEFIPAISEAKWKELTDDKDNCLLNRCTRDYPPGSAYVPLTALAGISAGAGDSHFNCAGSIDYNNRNFKCWKGEMGGGHGMLNLREAVAQSCLCYWYQLGNAAGITALTHVGELVGFGQRYGITPDEGQGILPDPKWLAEHQPNQKWSAGTTANASTGQGMVLATPLQLTVLAATVANGGKIPQPRMIHTANPAQWRADLVKEGLPQAQIEELRRGMAQTVSGKVSTGHAAHSDTIEIAGKTGTVQNWRQVEGSRLPENDGWFIAFAPYDKPTLAIVVFVQGVQSGGATCAPIAKQMIEECLALPANGTGAVQPMEASHWLTKPMRP